MNNASLSYDQHACQARQEALILDNLGLVRHAIGKLVADLPPGVDLENLESAGVLGLVEAARNYDPERATAFPTYAYPRIRGAVLDELRRNCPLPQQILERVTAIRRAADAMSEPATPEALAQATGLAEQDVDECLEAMRLTRIAPLDEFREKMAPEANLSTRPDAAAELAEQKQQLARAIKALSERDRLVVTLYYLEDLRLKEIGKLLGISESRVSRTLSAALLRLTQRLNGHKD